MPAPDPAPMTFERFQDLVFENLTLHRYVKIPRIPGTRRPDAKRERAIRAAWLPKIANASRLYLRALLDNGGGPVKGLREIMEARSVAMAALADDEDALYCRRTHEERDHLLGAIVRMTSVSGSKILAADTILEIDGRRVRLQRHPERYYGLVMLPLDI